MDAKTTAQALICVSEDSREAVDTTVDRAGAAGGVADPSPIQDFGFIYARSDEDPDAHIREVIWMDPTAINADVASPAQN
ncbi:hypothetical protein [Hansschlegelia plantiphila]|uniref:VOC domain-containing protein n=1 Tax=Hansschlegelia plantiphila TaxID=374655 RepID=A0A9W6J4C1_9HYPH|nr:hypothetical protein [Hansschlegelia plantiphila]GLK69124.1 hypothetical protein GCM10008179_27620 [Hansschlegelia plantiphila]